MKCVAVLIAGCLGAVLVLACSQIQDVGFTDPRAEGGLLADANREQLDASTTDGNEPSVICELGLSACGDTCVDLAGNAANCGRCGRSCEGCDRGTCPKEILACTNCSPWIPGGPNRLLVDDGALYWTSSTCVNRANKDGSAAGTIACPDSPPDGQLVMDATRLYWTSSTTTTTGAIFVATKGATLATTLLALPTMRPFGLGLDDATKTLFFGNLGIGQDPASFPSRIGFTSLTAPSEKTLGTAPVKFLRGIAATADAVLVTVSDDGSLRRVSRTDGTVKTLATGFVNPIAVLVDGADAYVVDAGRVDGESPTGSITRVPLASGAKVAVATGVWNPEGIAVDADYIYFTTQGTFENGYEDGSVVRVSKDGGQLLPLATNEPNPRGIGVDAAFVYWADHGTSGRPGAIMRTPR